MTDERVAALLFDEPGTATGTREKLVVTALRAFASSGYDGVSVRDVERLAGVNRGLTAYHFGSKEGLWRACVDLLMAKFHEEMERYRAVLRVVSPPERGKVLLKVFVGFVSKHPEFFRLLVMHGADSSDRMEWFVRGLRETLDFFAEVTGTKDSPSSPEDEAMACYLFLGAASMIFAVPAQCQMLFGVDPLDPAFIERFTEIVSSFGFYNPQPLGGISP